MTKEEFRKLTENILILDGATGSNLMASGMQSSVELVYAVYSSYHSSSICV